ncbi:hypothetical protein T11_8496 [Trichinella zimbabwensis]|uniref:Uncharacterized protein n=1 Tax=Trichinella zimbabwensis TaxID=268475 RepID=A0A0V1HWL6_9BILA|nr:hypothetical protein T11_8496 [Trichinella zimbabwensis]
MSESRLLKSEQSGISRLQLTIIPTSKLEQREIRICLCLLSLSEQPTLVCRYAVELQVQCKAVSAYDVPHHNSVYGKKALRTGDWSTAAPVLRFQTLDPDWSIKNGQTCLDMSRLPLSC